MSSANKDVLTISLPIHIPFISYSCLIALARNSRTMLNRSGKSEHLVLFLILGEMVCFSPLSMMFSVGLSYITFTMLRYIPSIPSFLRAFYHEVVLDLIKGFLCIY
jgi:hypothetical protein